MQSKRKWSLRAAGRTLALLALSALSASAQVPQDFTFSGRLVDGSGTPLVGPVDLDLYIMSTETGFSPLYGERQHDVPLDAQGNFSVLLGSSFDVFPWGSFDAAIVSGAERYVEVQLVAATLEALSPRVPLSSVPYALIAQQAIEIVPDPSAPRFEDCGNGTVADHLTGLQWEKKEGSATSGSPTQCATSNPFACLNPHYVNSIYQLSQTGPPFTDDGEAYRNFLERLNGNQSLPETRGFIWEVGGLDGPGSCFAHHCDWRLPSAGELRSIGSGGSCASPPCMAPGFTAVAGPTAASSYWSVSVDKNDSYQNFDYDFSDNTFNSGARTFYQFVRAVRAGSCR